MGFFSEFFDDLVDPNRRERRIAEQNLQRQLTQQRGVLTSNLAASGLSGPTRQFGIESALGDIGQRGRSQIQSQFPQSNFLPQLLFTLAGAGIGGAFGGAPGASFGASLGGGLAGGRGGGGGGLDFASLFGGGASQGQGIGVNFLEQGAQQGLFQGGGSPLGSIQGFDAEAFRSRFSQTGGPSSIFSLRPLTQ